MRRGGERGSRPRRRRLTQDRAAEQDLIAIWIDSFETWGKLQADRYLAQLETRIRGLPASPHHGTSRDALRPGSRSVHVRHHIAFTTFDEEEVRLRRVLHEVMDVGRHL